MQKALTEEEFQQLLAEHDRLTDADGKPRLVSRTLAEFQRGPSIAPPSSMREPKAAPGG